MCFGACRVLHHGCAVMPDSELLSRYVRDGSEAAFTELVGRHVDLVFSAALRLVGGDRHLAQDVTQNVFVDLCRKARSLARRDSLAGWLHTAARFTAAKAVRTERRRGIREQEALRMRTLLPNSDADWDEVRPVLDEAIGDTGSREGLSGIDGTFELKGCRPGRIPLTAEAPGFGAVTRDVDVTAHAGPFRIVLRRGMPFRLRVLNDQGLPVPGATVRLGPAMDELGNRNESSPVQTYFEGTADDEGEAHFDVALRPSEPATVGSPRRQTLTREHEVPPGRHRGSESDPD